MLSLDHIGLEFGGRWLFRDASYQFLPGERFGLIGRNGAGKSTLLKLIHGDISPSEGKIHRAGKLEVAFFNQDLLSFRSDESIFSIAKDAFAPQLKLQADIEHLLHRLEQGATDPALLDDLTHKQQLFDSQGGNLIDSRVHTTLAGLGFSDHERIQPFSTFSGGWRMRVLLAKMLLMDPDILLLDEPTNHLDLPSIQWLENYLKTFPGTCIVVSHDRFFVDRMADRILEISHGQLHYYGGNYSYYEKEKALRLDQQRKAYDNQQKYIAEQEKLINRFRYKASKAKFAQSRINALERLERVAAPEEDGFSFHLNFKIRTTSGKEVLRLKNISKAYDEKKVLQHTTATVMRGDKIALIGANGMGKSTLLRIIADTEPHEGVRESGHNVEMGFFAQHQLEALNLSNNILEELTETAVDRTENEIRTVLGGFMFSGEDVEKKIQVLSGGEKSRVALAKTLTSEANFLLLDEPTNHLDIPSIQVLVDALQAYEGTYVLVSHDRYFLRKIANKIWFIEDMQIHEYIGTFDEYAAWQEGRQTEKLNQSPLPSPEKQKETESENSGTGLSYQEQKQRKNRIKKLERQQRDIEQKIEKLEGEIAEKEEQMTLPEIATDFDRLSEVQGEYQRLQEQVETLTGQWEEVLLELESLQS